VKLGQVNIDTDDGMELAQDLDVLDAGVPSVWAFDKANGEGRVLWKDDTEGRAHRRRARANHLRRVSRRGEDGQRVPG
jgi:hypothetical protein